MLLILALPGPVQGEITLQYWVIIYYIMQHVERDYCTLVHVRGGEGHCHSQTKHQLGVTRELVEPRHQMKTKPLQRKT